MPAIPAIPGMEGVEPKEEEATKQEETANNATSEPQQEVQVQVQEAAALPNIPNDEPQSYTLLSVTDLPPPLRRGKWTAEESSYANRLIHEFRCGSLALPNNITLREFLSKLLRCDPMRITKKFEGDNSLRKVVYKRMADDGVAHVIRGEIRLLEGAFLERLEHTRSTSSQAVADKALLDAFRHSEASDLIELFCLNLKSEAANNAASASSDAGYVHARGGASYKRQNEYTVDNGAVVQSVPSFQRDLLMHLSRMQMLIQQQQLGLMSAEEHSSAMLPPLKKFKTDQEEANETASSADQAYNMAVSNLLSIQRMIMDNKHKLYDIEFNLAESVELNSEEPTTTSLHHAHDDTERKNQVMALIRQEIEDLEKQKVEMEREIELKYKSVGNDDSQQQQQQQDVVDETVHHDAEMKVEFD